MALYECKKDFSCDSCKLPYCIDGIEEAEALKILGHKERDKKAENKARCREYYENNKARLDEKHRKWAKDNPDKMREYRRRFKEKHPGYKQDWKRRHNGQTTLERPGE